MELDELTRHPRNVHFEWVDRTGPFRRLTAEQVAGFDRDGFVVLERALPEDDLAALVAEIDPMEAELEDLLRTAEDGKVFIARADEITFTTHLVTRSERIRRLAASVLFTDLCHDLVGPDVRFYWDQAVYKKPDTEAPFPWHQDNGYAFVEPQQYLTCWIALTDATLDNGCPWILPGMHRAGTLDHRLTDIGFVCFDEQPTGAVPVEVPAGSVVAFSSLTPHTTKANATDEVRKAYITQYASMGSEVLSDDGQGGTLRVPAVDPDRQFPVLVGGEPVPAP
jgi:ectoine hydroxylase-related dioxygenase (phytanoyl-CoA dioxygenase family)